MSGTVGYMAPEQVRGHVADPRSDIFAFGVVLYEMITGKRAFRKGTSAETLSAILNEEPLPLAQSVQNLPPALQRIVSRCLEKKPERRFQHASDLGFALEALSDASGTTIPGVPEAAARRRWIWIAAAVVAVAVGSSSVRVVEAATGGSCRGSRHATHQRRRGQSGLRQIGDRWLAHLLRRRHAGGLQDYAGRGHRRPHRYHPTRLANFQFTALSQDGSYLLGGAGDAFVLPFWAVPLPSGESRRLGFDGSQDADLFPDGRILYCLGNDIYVAEKDGSNPRKLLTVDGVPVEPSVSPDGERLVFTLWSPAHRPISIDEVGADGSGLHVLIRNSVGERLCCARWTPDGRYIVYENKHEGRRDLWILPMQSGFLRRSRSPIQLTNGPLSYRSAVSSRDGKQIFAVGMEARGDWSVTTQMRSSFSLCFPAFHAFDPSWSADGKWVAYTAYPDHALWRSRSDGTDPLQLTSPPGQLFAPSISPDGKQVAYVNSAGAICLIDMDGGSPPTIRMRTGPPHGRRTEVSWCSWIAARQPISTSSISAPAGVPWFPDRQTC